MQQVHNTRQHAAGLQHKTVYSRFTTQNSIQQVYNTKQHATFRVTDKKMDFRYDFIKSFNSSPPDIYDFIHAW